MKLGEAEKLQIQKLKERKGELENIEFLYKSREAVIKLFNDYTKQSMEKEFQVRQYTQHTVMDLTIQISKYLKF